MPDLTESQIAALRELQDGATAWYGVERLQVGSRGTPLALNVLAALALRGHEAQKREAELTEQIEQLRTRLRQVEVGLSPAMDALEPVAEVSNWHGEYGTYWDPGKTPAPDKIARDVGEHLLFLQQHAAGKLDAQGETESAKDVQHAK